MPELPEVEVLVRHLRPLLRGKTIRAVRVRRAKVVAPGRPRELSRVLTGAKFTTVARRGKYLLFGLYSQIRRQEVLLLGHLGMAGRMFLARKSEPLPRHAAVVLDLGRKNFIYEDPRYFGRFTLDVSAVKKLGPEPLGKFFSAVEFARRLKRTRQPVKVKLLDQSLVAGVGNIYASEALFRAGISPRRPANRLTVRQVKKLQAGIRLVLAGAIRCGSTIPLNFAPGKTDGLFYFGRAAGVPDYYGERLQVYDRAGKPCFRCDSPIRRLVQSARSTFYCPRCQKD
ncbi:MAG: bifunctional DNA-formamidopyrimidine glycosylase/DNA-(apurinic or apyrimidinic site) lyase [Verrucomicrobiota bacterium]